jgi:hypothetical protein
VGGWLGLSEAPAAQAPWCRGRDAEYYIGLGTKMFGWPFLAGISSKLGGRRISRVRMRVGVPMAFRIARGLFRRFSLNRWGCRERRSTDCQWYDMRRRNLMRVLTLSCPQEGDSGCKKIVIA